MRTITRILCPIDFSAFSRHALEHALAIAGRYHATVTTLHVIPAVLSPLPAIDSPLYPPVAFTAADLDQFRDELRQFVGEPPAGTFVECAVAQGNVAQEIAWAAEKMPADLIVMGTHGRSGFEGLMLGSVTERVLRSAPCPVLTVPARVADAPRPGQELFERILCAIDFSPSSLAALEYAASLADAGSGSLSLVHVFEPVAVLEPAVAGGVAAAYDAEARAKEAAEHRILDVAAGVSCGVDRVVTAEGKAYREILRAAAEQQSDLIAIGVHSGGSGLLAFGSTTNQIVRQATCPVLSLKA